MMLALLVLLTLMVLVLPLIPALREWMWPKDVVPLKIDEADALDPPYLAQSFAALLTEAVQAGATHLGESVVVHMALADGAAMPLQEAEVQAGRSNRLWHVEGGLQLPEQVGFYAEVSASAGLRTAPHNVYRALWAGEVLALAPFGTVLRWAHGHTVHIGTGCHLAGRVTAQHALTVAQEVDFMLLHAPRIDFVAPEGSTSAPLDAMPCVDMAEWPAGVAWNSTVRRAFARTSLQVDAQRAWLGDVVCLADMALGAHCQAGGSLKARGDLSVGAGCHVSGSVVAEGVIYLAAHSVVLGSVLSETAIMVGPGCTIGAPGAPATVTAPQIQIAAGVTVYGTVWAEQQGRTTRATPAPFPMAELPLNTMPAYGVTV